MLGKDPDKPGFRGKSDLSVVHKPVRGRPYENWMNTKNSLFRKVGIHSHIQGKKMPNCFTQTSTEHTQGSQGSFLHYGHFGQELGASLYPEVVAELHAASQWTDSNGDTAHRTGRWSQCWPRSQQKETHHGDSCLISMSPVQAWRTSWNARLH